MATKRELAEIFGVTPRTIENWINKGVPVKTRGGRGIEWDFNTPDVIEWFIEYRTGSNSDLSKERANLAKAQAKKVNLEVRKLEGDLVSREAILNTWNEIILLSRSHLLAMPSKLTPRLIGQSDHNTIFNIIKDDVYQTLTELAEADPLPPDHPERET